MKEFVKDMPFYSELDGKTDCAIWQSGEHICELKDDGRGVCDPSGLFYGTTDSREPKFCARHFYMDIVSGNGKTNYKLMTGTRSEEKQSDSAPCEQRR